MRWTGELSLEFIEAKSTPEPNTGCWIWTGEVTPNGYGRIERDGKRLRANRVAWSLANGPIPDGRLVCHHCDNRLCVNPAHLYAGTQQDNMNDMWRRGRAKGRPATQPQKPKTPPKVRLFVGNRLTLEQALSIRGRHGCPETELASEFGVTVVTVRHIRKGRTWRDPSRYAPGRRRHSASRDAGSFSECSMCGRDRARCPHGWEGRT